MHRHQTASLAQQKERLRASLKQRLAKVSPQQAKVAAGQIAERLLELPEVAHAKGVLTCLSFGDEVDTWNLVEDLLASGRTVYVPRADANDTQLHVHRYPCSLRTLSFGLQQPPRGTPEVPEQDLDQQIDVALVLGLGFDRRGYRLGYGSGYFDRFLVDRRFAAIGLAFDLQLVDAVPAEPHDVALAAVVTERAVWRPTGDVHGPR